MNDIAPANISPDRRAATIAAGSHRLGVSQELQPQQPGVFPATPMPTPQARQPQGPPTDADAGMPVLPQEGQDKVFTLIRAVNRIDPRGVGMEKIMEVRLKAPSALDLFEVGGMPSQPTWGDKGMTMDMNVDRLKAWLTRLSGLPTPTIYEMHAKDLRNMYEWLNGELASSGN